MFLVLGVSQHFKEMFVSHFPAAVFRGTAAFTLKADRVLDLLAGLHCTLEDHLVLPVIAKVIRVFKNESLAVLRKDVAEEGRERVFAFGVVGIVNITGDAVSVRANIEIMEMAVGRAEGHLNVPVKIAKRTILDLEPSPDRGFDLKKIHPELIDGLGGLGFGGCPRGGGFLLGFFGGFFGEFLFRGHGGGVQERTSDDELCLETLQILVREELIRLQRLDHLLAGRLFQL